MLPSKVLNHSSTGVTLAVNTVNVLSNIFTAVVPKGLAWVFPGEFVLKMKLICAAAAESPSTARFYFGYKTPEDDVRVVPVGSPFLYQPWAATSIANQQDVDLQRAITVNLGSPVLTVQQDESLVIQLVSSVAIVTASCEIYLPYAERSPAEVVAEIALRKAQFGR
jgi:hypothetical protein